MNTLHAHPLRTFRRLVWALPALICFAVTAGALDRAHADDAPVIIKTSIHIDPLRGSDYWTPGAAKPVSVACWIPQVSLEVRGPVPSGSRCYAAFTHPSGAPWFEVPLQVDEQPDDAVVKYVTPTGSDLEQYAKKYTTGIGSFGIKIRLHDELGAADTTLFTGKFRVVRISRAQGTPDTKNDADFYVDHDWTLPIGYIWFYADGDRHAPALRVSTWLRGRADMDAVAGYLYYQGKVVADTKSTGGGMDSKTSHETCDNRPTDPSWTLWDMCFNMVRRTTPSGDNAALFILDKNPGDYEVKLLRKGELARDIKFTVGDDGRVVDPGTTAANHMGTTCIIVPAKVEGALDGTWNAAEWSTDAFYGNPLTGFAAP